jgi:lauroyl/myristoyl acyltransferase
LPDGTHEVSVIEAMEPQSTRAWVEEATTRANTALERFVRANPTEWLWMHRRWKTPAQ